MNDTILITPPRSRSTILFIGDGPDAGTLAAAADALADTVVVRTVDARDLLAGRHVDVIIFDEGDGGSGARALLADAAELRPAAARILLSADPRPAAAVEADFTVLPKPVEASALRAVCAMALRCAASARRARQLAHENRRLRGDDVPAPEGAFDDLGRVERYEGLLTRSPAMARVLAFLQRVEGGDAPLVIQGDAGTGKQCVAEAIHARSRRRGGPFVVVNLGGFPDRMRESMLFGHRAGAGPDGPAPADGRVLEGDGGTLYIDDIADANPALQLALLRLLEDGSFTPLGADRPRRVQVRLLSGTHRNLDEMVRQGLFRRDLHERLRIAAVELPALRERSEDVFLLARHFLGQASLAIGRKGPGISREARAVLESYHWPGNVRELRNVMERAAILCKGGLLIAADLPLGWSRPADDGDVPAGAAAIAIPAGGTTLKQLEREIFLKTLALAGGNQSRAAQILGLCESTFRFRLHKLGIASRRTPAKTSQLTATSPVAARA